MSRATQRLAQDRESKMAEIGSQIQEKRWRKARRRADLLLDDMSGKITSGLGATRFVARGTLLRSLAQAGAGNLRDARWDWHMTRAFEKEIAFSDLKGFGEPGRWLEAYRESLELKEDGRLVAFEDVLTPGPDFGDSLTVPKRKRFTRPRSPGGTRQAGILGYTNVSLIVEKDGRLSNPVVNSAISATQTYEALEALRDWRYEPATYKGEPVRVHFNLQVNFSLKGR
ncbi:MAG: energy transducer TonB [Acidobacteriota bacterium]